MIIGIDPGLKGGIVRISEKFGCEGWPMPVVKSGGSTWVDFGVLATLIGRFRDDVVVVEKVHSRPGQSCVSTFTFGLGFGGILGVCAGMRMKYELATPQNWQKEIFKGMDAKLGKGRSLLYCKQRWPEYEILHKKDGIADAACIAEYGRRHLI